MNLKLLALQLNQKLGANVIPVRGKNPTIEWSKWQTVPMTREDIKKLDFSFATGIAIINGVNNICSIDLDKCSAKTIVNFIHTLGLAEHYPFVDASGSGTGGHIFFGYTYSSHLEEKILGGTRSSYRLKLKDEPDAYAELRVRNCTTVFAGSRHPDGGWYKLLNLPSVIKNPSFSLSEFTALPPADFDIPDEPLFQIPAGTLIKTILLLCDLPDSGSAPALAEGETIPNSEFRIPNSLPAAGSAGSKRGKYKKTRARLINHELCKSISEFLRGKVDNYDDWLRLGMGFRPLGPDGAQYFVHLSTNHPKYPKDTPAKVKRDYDSICRSANGSISFGTVIHIAQRYGWTPPAGIKITANQYLLLTESLNYRYDFLNNTFTQKLFYKLKSETSWREISDAVINSIYIFVKKEEQIKVTYDDVYRLLHSDFVPARHTVKDYITALPEWDGSVDYIRLLADTVEVLGDKEFWTTVLTMWYVGIMAAIFTPDITNHIILILQGPPGIGKSDWIFRCLPLLLQCYITSMHIDPHNKDALLATCRNIIVNLDEFEYHNRESYTALNSLVTNKIIELRPAYGRVEQKYIRCSSFIGSVNTLDFLNDISGTRRFLSFSVKSINYRHEVDMDGVLSQAYSMFKNGYKYYFSPDDAEGITLKNMDFTFMGIEEELLLRKYRVPLPGDPVQRLTATQICENCLNRPYITSREVRVMGQILQKYHFRRCSQWTGSASVKTWEVSPNTKGTPNDNII